MPFNPLVLATINLAVQVILLIGLVMAISLAKKRRLIRHCNVVRVVVVVQLISIFLFMAPSMSTNLSSALPADLQLEMRFHSGLGILILILWLYINLAVGGRLRVLGALKIYMRTAFVLWSLVFLIGLHLYLRLYVLG